MTRGEETGPGGESKSQGRVDGRWYSLVGHCTGLDFYSTKDGKQVVGSEKRSDRVYLYFNRICIEN